MKKDKYQRMADALRADGADEAATEKFVAMEKEHDEFARNSGITDIAAYKKWMALPEETRRACLTSAFCLKCMSTTIAPGYAVRQDKIGIVIEGVCSKCGRRVVRCCY